MGFGHWALGFGHAAQACASILSILSIVSNLSIKAHVIVDGDSPFPHPLPTIGAASRTSRGRG